jgi:hypothetical protein
MRNKNQLYQKYEKILFLSLFFILVFMPGIFLAEANNTPYYLDNRAAPGGNGTTKLLTGSTCAFKTISQINSHADFQPGDKILIAQGETFITPDSTGLRPKGSGSASGQITIDSYDAGMGNAKPVIDAQGKNNSRAIYLENTDYWTIQNLEVRNWNASNTSTRQGIWIGEWIAKPGPDSVYHSIKIINNTVRKVKGSNIHPYYYDNSGIRVQTNQLTVKLDDILIQNNQLDSIYGQGIFFIGETSDGGVNWWNYLSTNVVVRGNTVSQTGADGIVIWGTDNELVEYNLVDGAGQLGRSGGTGVGTAYLAALWSGFHKNGVIQYNEIRRTKLWVGDGQALDNDNGLWGATVFQYNYTHDNEGGFFLDCYRGSGDPQADYDANAHSIVRYNISQNDGSNCCDPANPYKFFHLIRSKAKIYNNVFYTSPGHKFRFIIESSTTNDTLINNIFVGDSIVFSNCSHLSTFIFDHNCFWGGCQNVPSGCSAGYTNNNPTIADPAFIGPAGGGGNGLGSVQCYKLKVGSPCIGAGATISNNGGLDYWGKHLYGTQRQPSIGAYERPNMIPVLKQLLVD